MVVVVVGRGVEVRLGVGEELSHWELNTMLGMWSMRVMRLTDRRQRSGRASGWAGGVAFVSRSSTVVGIILLKTMC